MILNKRKLTNVDRNKNTYTTKNKDITLSP